MAGINHLKRIISTQPSMANVAEFEEFYGKKSFENLLDRIVRNSFSNDIHFILSDNQDKEWSIIPVHSAVLFRHLMTAPIEIFDMAQDLSVSDWSAKMTRLSRAFPYSKAFKSLRPLKALTISPIFLHDLLARFVTLYFRMGSPDFTEHAIAGIRCQLRRDRL